MANTEQSIRISAKGEFSQLQRGLKDLKGDLKNVLGEIDKGARKGGIFDDTSLRALDLYKRRLKDTMGELDKELTKQNNKIDRLHEKMAKASDKQRASINEQIKAREKELDVIRKQLYAMEKMYNKRTSEASGYDIKPSGTSAGSAMVPAALSGGFGKAMGLIGTIGKFAMGLAGLSSMIALGQRAYQLAYERQVESLDLAQRMRGYGFNGSNISMYNQVRDIGQRDNMGYNASQSWAVQDVYTRSAGRLGSEGQYGIQKFARGYGLDATETAGIFGSAKQLGGFVKPKEFADMIAGSVSQSGMLPRIHEVMQAHTGLLQNLNSSFRDGASKQILAYQTVLDTLGNKNGMTRLTGAQGANVIGGLGGIFSPGNDKWKWTGIAALQNYDKKKYGGMGLYDLESSFEQGLMNPDNLPAMAKYLQSQSGGNTEVFKRLMQSWLTDGGFGATKGQVSELYKVTNGFTAFDEASVNKAMKSVDSGAKYNLERKGEQGQTILQVDAKFDDALAQIGQKYMLEPITSLKSDFANIAGALTGEKGLAGIWDAISNSSPLLKGILAAVAISAGANIVGGAKDIASMFKRGGKGGGGGGVGKAASEVQIGQNIRGGKLSKAESEAISSLSGGNKAKQEVLEQVYRSTGDLDAVKKVATGKATTGEFVDILSNGDPKVAEQLAKHLDKTGDVVSTVAKAKKAASGGGILARQLAKGGKGLRSVGRIASKVPIVGGVIDFGLNKLSGQSTGEAATRAVGSGLGGWGGAAAGAAIGTLILPGVGTAIGGLIGGIGGALLGDRAGKGVSDWFKKTSGKGESVSLEELSKKGTLEISALNEDGVNALNALQKEGVVRIDEFSADGKAKLSILSESGAKQILELQKNGSVAMSSMDTATKTKLNEILSEHKSFTSNMSNFFTGVGSTINGWFGGKSAGGSGGASSGYDVRNISNVTASQLDAKFKGVLKGHGDDFIKAGMKYGIDPAFLAAVSMHETGNGTSSAARNRNNVGGMMGRNGLMSFGTIDMGIEAMARNLKNLYIDKGLVTPEDIQRKYAPVGAANDPTNLNSYWSSGVLGSYKGLLSGTGSTSLKTPSGEYADISKLANDIRNSAPSVFSAPAEQKITMDINIGGDGAKQLNSMTTQQLKSFVEQIFKEMQQKNLAMNPTARS